MNKEILKLSLIIAFLVSVPLNLLGVFTPTGYGLLFYLLKFLFWFAISFPVVLGCSYIVLKDIFRFHSMERRI